MKRIVLFSAVLALAGGVHAQSGFSVKGEVTGHTDSLKVQLVGVEGSEHKKLALAARPDGKFELTGNTRVPQMAQVVFYAKGKKGQWVNKAAIDVMLDGQPLSVTMPEEVLADGNMSNAKKRLKARIAGGPVHQQYQDYLDYIAPYQQRSDSLSYVEAMAWFAQGGIDDSIKAEKAAKNVALKVLRDKKMDYIKAHPDNAVSAGLVVQFIHQPFEYSVDEFDGWMQTLKNNPDTTHVNLLKRNEARIRKQATGAGFTDFTAKTTDNKQVKLSSLMEKGKITLIDFWASWCGPCRSAIPKVAQMAKDYAGRLKVVSCSVDQKEDAWRKAEKEEAMPWPQLLISQEELGRTAGPGYMISSIPRLVVIDEAGRVMLVTHDPGLVRRKIAELSASSFSVSGDIPGIKDGTRVSLVCREQGKEMEKVTCLTKGSSFRLTGRVDGTALVELRINDKPEAAYGKGDYPNDHGTQFLLENADYTVTAACFDSIPLNYGYDKVPLRMARNVRIEGGEAQRQYNEWAEATYDARLAAAEASLKYRMARFVERGQKKPEQTEVDRLEALSQQADAAEIQATDRFVAAHPDYAVSLLWQAQRLDKPFAYTKEEYEKMKSLFAANYDLSRYEAFVGLVDDMKRYPREAAYTDLSLETPEGKTINLKDVIVPGKYNFIDFWASWCGPCRAAIPNVKKLHAKMGKRLNVLSVSVDKKKADWIKAKDEEKMPWSQYIVPQSSMKALKDGYYVKYIPSLVVIDPEGRIQLFTSDPSEAHAYLEEHVK